MVVRPNMDASVICKVLENIGEVQLHEGWAFLEAPCCLQTITNTTIETRESIFMEKGNIYILRYKTVKSFLEKRMVEFT